MNEQPTGPAGKEPPADIVDQALASLRQETVPDGPSPELISATHRTLWYPFRSPEVADICRHMTPEEIRQLSAYATRVGVLGGIIPSLFFYPLFYFLAFYTPLYPPGPWSILVLLAIAVPLGLLFGWIGFAGIRRKQIRMLCDTGYARQRGINPQTLRLYELPGSRGTLIFIVVMISLPAVLLTGLIFIGPQIPGVALFVPSSLVVSPVRKILDQMSSVYANCQSYQDSGVVNTRIIKESGNHSSERPFTTAYVRPERFRYEFKSMPAGGLGNRRFIIWSDGKDVQLWWDVRPGIEKPASLALALGGANGVSGGSSIMIPAFLLTRQKMLTVAAAITDAKLEADDRLEGIECFRITGKYGDHPMTLWIDKQCYLIRRIDERSLVEDFLVKQTTTYTPIINGVVPEQMLEFNPPVMTP